MLSFYCQVGIVEVYPLGTYSEIFLSGAILHANLALIDLIEFQQLLLLTFLR